MGWGVWILGGCSDERRRRTEKKEGLVIVVVVVVVVVDETPVFCYEPHCIFSLTICSDFVET